MNLDIGLFILYLLVMETGIIIQAAFFAWAAGSAAFLGGVLSASEKLPGTELKKEALHGITALGGGGLIAAVAFALAPKGIEHLPPLHITLAAASGGAVFCALDAAFSRGGKSRAEFLAFLLDFIPEALALGAVFARDRVLGIFLSVFIFIQNLPEGFNSHREMTAAGVRSSGALGRLFAAGFLGPAAALAGTVFLSGSPGITAFIATFASGGILYLVFQDIAPVAKMGRHRVPALGAVLGFILGMAGTALMGAH